MRKARHCTCCGKPGHTVSTCKAPGATKIRELMGKLRLRVGQRVRKSRVGGQKTGVHAKKAMKAYTPKVIKPTLKKTARTVSAWGAQGRRAKFLRENAIGAKKALRRLIDAGYVAGLSQCQDEECGGSIEEEPVTHRNDAALYWRCSNWRCRKRHPVLRFSPWPETRLTVAQLCRAIEEYTEYDKRVPPEVDDIAKAAGAGRAQISPVVKFLREKEAARGKAENEEGTVAGDLETDVHGVCKIYVSPNNPHYQHLLPEKHATSPEKYYQLFHRVAGLRPRGRGKFYIKFVRHHTLVPPKARPPPESIDEILETDILSRGRKGSVLHSDGAPCYPALAKHPRYAAKKFRLPTKAVCHKENEFVGKTRRVGGTSSLTGTQCGDRAWKELDRCIPATLHRKTADHQLNPEIDTRIWAWLYRYNHAPCSDGFAQVGALVGWK